MQIPQLAAKLTSLGLTDKQAKVYAANLLLGPAPANRIAEQAGVNRPTTYDILDELCGLGLVSQSKSPTKKLFTATGLDGLETMLQQQTETIARRKQALSDMATELQAVARSSQPSAPIVRFVSGKQAIDALWAEVMRSTPRGTEILSVTNHDQTLPVYPDRLTSNAQYRISKRLSSKQFYYNSRFDEPSNQAMLKQTIKLAEAPAGDLTLYDDIAVLLSYGGENQPWSGIIIESPDIVRCLRQLFMLAWATK